MWGVCGVLGVLWGAYGFTVDLDEGPPSLLMYASWYPSWRRRGFALEASGLVTDVTHAMEGAQKGLYSD